jgi:hypothetical protein
MNDAIKTKTLDNVLIQENGIIRDNTGLLIGRLVDDIKFENLESRPVDGVVINFLPDAVKTVTKAIREDKDLYIAYQANIAMPFQDEYNEAKRKMEAGIEPFDIHTVANNAAKYFLDLWCKE